MKNNKLILIGKIIKPVETYDKMQIFTILADGTKDTIVKVVSKLKDKGYISQDHVEIVAHAKTIIKKVRCNCGDYVSTLTTMVEVESIKKLN